MMKRQSVWWLVVMMVGACSFPQLSRLGSGDDVTGDDAGADDAPIDAGVAMAELTLVAGEIGGRGNADDVGRAARFNGPTGVAVDRNGNTYVADTNNSTIRKVAASGTVTTIAGLAGVYGGTEGPGAMARFDTPASVAADAAGNLYVADTNNSTIRKITPAGVVSTLAGTIGLLGSTDDTGAAARFRFPAGIAVDSNGTVYVADTGNATIRKITPAGVVTTLAGSPQQVGSADGTGATARFNAPTSVAVDGGGNVFVTDTSNHTIRKITPAGGTTTFAGSAGVSGSANGDGTNARFNLPTGVSVDRNGNLVVADRGNQMIRAITFAGTVTTLAGALEAGSVDDTGAAARFRGPSGVAIDSVGTVFVVELGNHTLRKIGRDGAVTTLAGAAAVPGSTNGASTVARFDLPAGAAIDATGTIFVADVNNHVIRKITSDGVVSTFAGSAGLPGSANGQGAAARFSSPFGVTIDGDGNLYVADTDNNTIRKITRDGLVSTLAGTPGTAGSANGTGAAARFDGPTAIAVDAAGNLYIADQSNQLIRKVTGAGVVTTLAGNAGQPGSQNGTGPDAHFNSPAGVAVDGAGNVYVADQNNQTVRKITPAGEVTTLSGTAGMAGTTDGLGPAARFRSPVAVAVDATGNVYVADNKSATIRRIAPDGDTRTFAGTPDAAGIRLGAAPRLAFPRGLAMAGTDVIVCDIGSVLRLHPTVR